MLSHRFILAAVLLAAAPALAQDKELVPDKVESDAAARANAGWVPKLGLGASFSFAHSSSVVGAADGQTWNIGPQLDLLVGFYRTPHEWRSSLAIRHVQTRSPVIDEFVKTVDSMKVGSAYLYHIPGVSWLGPFAEAGLETALFPGMDVRPTTTTWAIKERDASINQRAGTRLHLTEPFAPLLIKQSAGMFAVPLDRAEAKIEVRLGVGAREAIMQDGIVINDDAATPAIVEASRLADFQQVGGELFAGIGGTLVWDALGKDRPVTYAIGTLVLMPFFTSLDQPKSNLELTTVDFEAKVGVKLFAWASLDYALVVTRAPLIIDEVQVQNSLLLNFSYALIQ